MLPLLFRLPPERAHTLALTLLRWAAHLRITHYVLRPLFEVHDSRLATSAFGLHFKNPIGLAAGYDKNGVAVNGLAALGFGHVEVGTVTRRPQSGNPRPRVFRIPEAQAVINRMGFPNEGVEKLQVASGKWQVAGSKCIVGVNISKGKDTPLEQAADDYCELLKQVHPFADYVTINISSPNTQGLRQLQGRAALETLLLAVTRVREGLPTRAPLLLKIAPDLNEGEIDDVLAAATACGIDGLIATNTTLSREGVPTYAAPLTGGLSGAPLRAHATAIVRYLAQRTALPIIGVGGIMNPADALEKLDAGATLVQVYTGLVYYGPGLARDINRALLIRNK
jgi:dihydroorotate dehydrogenase